MKNLFKLFVLLTSLAALGSWGGNANAATCTSAAAGNWNLQTTWGVAGIGCVGATGGIPGAADSVIVNGNFTVTVVGSVSAASMQLGQQGGGPGTGTGSLIFSAATSALTVTGIVTIGAGVKVGNIDMTNGGTLTTGSFVVSNLGTWIPGAGTVIMTTTNTLPGTVGFGTFHNLSVTSGTTTLGQNTNLTGALTIGSGVTLASSTFIQTVNGNITNDGTQTASTGSITLSGAAATHTLSGNGVYGNLILNDTLGATLAGSPTVSGVLTLTSGIITTGSNTLEVTSGCAAGIAGASATKYVLGNLSLHYPAGTTTCTFPIGVTGSYTPVVVTMVGVTSALANSSLTARTDSGDYPATTAGAAGINASSDVNLYWTLTPGASLVFTSYNPIFAFTPGNLDGGAATGTFIIGQYNGSAWSYPTIGAANATSTAAIGVTQATGFGVIVIGNRKLPSLTVLKTVAVYSDPVNLLVNPKNIPGAVAQYTIIAANSGGPADINTTIVTDPVPASTLLYVNDIGSVGSGPVLFSQGASSSTLTYTFTSLGSLTDNLDFSNDGGVTWAAIPTALANGCDATIPAITNIRIKPQGTFYGSAVIPNPSFQLTFRVCVK